MGDVLAHLYNSSPGVGSEGFCAVWALVVIYYIFNLEGLLQYCALEGFLLYGDLDSYSP